MNDLDPGPQCARNKIETSNQLYTSFDTKAELIKKNLVKMPITNDQKQLVKRWIVENYTFYVNKAYDYALLVSIGGQYTLKGMICLSKLKKSFKSYEQEKQKNKAKEQQIELF